MLIEGLVRQELGDDLLCGSVLLIVLLRRDKKRFGDQWKGKRISEKDASGKRPRHHRCGPVFGYCARIERPRESFLAFESKLESDHHEKESDFAV